MKRATVQLGDFLTLKRGYDLPEHARLPGEIPVISSSGVTGTHKEAKVYGPGVVTGRYGTLGEVFYIDEPFWPLNTALYVQDFKGNHRRFVSYFLRWVLNGTQSDKAAVPGVNRNDLHARKVQVPDDLSEQAEIASVLSAYDDLIENNRRRIQLLEQAARLLYKEWFVHLRFPGHEHTRIIDGVPEGWEVRPIKEIVEGVYDGPHATPPPAEHGAVFLGIKNITESGRLDLSSTRYIAEEDLPKWTRRVSPQAGDIVFSYEATLNLYALIPEGFRGCLGRRLALVRPIASDRSGLFLYFSFFSSRWRAVIEQNRLCGVTVDRVPIAKFPDFPLLMPPRKLIVSFHDHVQTS